jgi:hypothetical protein
MWSTHYAGVILIKLDFSRQIFEKKKPQMSNSIKIHPVGAEFHHVDGQTDITKLIVAICKCANAPNN